MRPRGKPPTPSARSSAIEPVGMASTAMRLVPSPRRMIAPLPNCFSMPETARSSARSRSGESRAPASRPPPTAGTPGAPDARVPRAVVLISPAISAVEAAGVATGVATVVHPFWSNSSYAPRAGLHGTPGRLPKGSTAGSVTHAPLVYRTYVLVLPYRGHVAYFAAGVGAVGTLASSDSTSGAIAESALLASVVPA